MIERAVVLGQGPEITDDDLPLRIAVTDIERTDGTLIVSPRSWMLLGPTLSEKRLLTRRGIARLRREFSACTKPIC